LKINTILPPLYQIDWNRPLNALLRRVGIERLIQPFAQLDEQGQ